MSVRFEVREIARRMSTTRSVPIEPCQVFDIRLEPVLRDHYGLLLLRDVPELEAARFALGQQYDVEMTQKPPLAPEES